MADGSIFQPLYRLPAIALPAALFTGMHAEPARQLATAHAQTQLRNLMGPTANRSPLRLHGLHGAVGRILCQMEAAHPEVAQVVGFAAHDGAVMRGGPGAVSERLVEANRRLAEEARCKVYNFRNFLDIVALANAQSQFLRGQMDETGCLVWQHNGKTCRLLPMEVCSSGRMELASDATVCAVDPTSIRLQGPNDIHMDLGWLHADIPLTDCGAFWEGLLVGLWKNGPAQVAITSDGITLSIRLRKGSIKSLLEAPLQSPNGRHLLHFKEGACAKATIKASTKTLSGNAGTMVHAQHSEANSRHPTAVIHALPLLSPNGRATGGNVEHPAGSVLATMQTSIHSEQEAIFEGREVPYGVQVGALMIDTGHGVELPETVYGPNSSLLPRLACATALSGTLDQTPSNERTASFRDCVEGMIRSLLAHIPDHELRRWREGLQWCGIGAHTHEGVALSRQQIDALQDRLTRHSSPGAAILLQEAGVLGGAAPHRWPWPLPMELLEEQGSTLDSFEHMACLSDGRGVVQALARTSELTHLARMHARL